MKKISKRMKSLLLAVSYVLIYCFVQIGVQALYLLYYESTGFSGEEIYEGLLAGSFAISVISAVLCLWIYLLIGYFRKKPAINYIKTRKCTIMELIMVICTAIGGRLIVNAYYHFAMDIDFLKKSIEAADEFAPQSMNTTQILIAIFAIMVVAPLFEEFLFRGLIMGELRNVLRPWAAIVFQAILFGVAHMSVFQSIFAFVMGIVLGIVYYKLNSIKAAAICHGVFNYSAVLTIMEMNNNSALIIGGFGIALLITAMIYIIRS